MRIRLGHQYHQKFPKKYWNKIAFAINYENANNFDNATFSAGVNPTKSVDGYFLSYADGVPLSLLQDSYYGELGHGAQQAFLGYQTYIINPVNENGNNTEYVSNVTPGGNYYQENSVYSNGYNGKLSFNLSSSYKDKIYIGLNLNSHFTNFYRSSNFYERNNNNTTGLNYTVKSLSFDNNLYTYGSGFSFQLGVIGKITKEARLGLSYESPTWYHLSDEFSQGIAATRKNRVDEITDVVNPNIINYYSPYELQTPGKMTFSFANIFGKMGLISLDYAIKDYSNTQFQPSNDSYYRSLNNQMSNTLSFTNEVRVGGEYKIKALSLRGGYRFEQSPYKNGKTIGDLNAISGGLGYNFGAFKMDFAYTHAERSSEQPFFSQGFTDAAYSNTVNNNYTMTLLFEM